MSEPCGEPAAEVESPGWLSARTVANASALNVGALAVQGALFLILTPLTFAALGALRFGAWTLMLALQATVSTVTFGASSALIKLVAEHRAGTNGDERIAASIGVAARILAGAGIVLGALLWLTREPLARVLGHGGLDSSFASGLGAIAIGLPVLTIGLGTRAVLLGLFLNREALTIDILQTALTGTGAIILGRAGASFAALGWWLVATQTICTIGALAQTPAQCRRAWWRGRWSREAAAPILAYARWAGLAAMASAAFGSADKLIVGVVLGPVAAGVYGIGTGVCDRLTQLTAPFSRVLVPFASSRLAAGKSESAAPLFELACRWVACLLASAGVVILLWGNYLLAHWISPSFAVDAGGMLRVLVIVYAGFSTAAPGYQMALGLGEVQLLAGLGVAGSLVSLVAIGLGGAKYGLLGAAVGNVPYLLVLGAPARVARLLGLPAWRVVLVDIGLPLLVLVPALVMSSSDAEIRAWASVSLLLLCGFFARERGRRASLGAILAE